jgi:sugar phosphate isomerase/epimerase
MFCTTPEQILELIDAIDRPNVAVCLDTGHAFVAGYEPAEFVQTLGDRLKVLHVHDNLGSEDQHVAPFAGAIDWGSFVAALRNIGFDGVFSLEVHRQVQNMPEPLIDKAVDLVHEIGRHLIESSLLARVV